GEVDVLATSTPFIVTIGLGIAQAEQWAVVAGSYSDNKIHNIIDAHISGSADVTASQAVRGKATDGGFLFARAGHVADSGGLAGNVADADGKAAVGAALSKNDISNTVKAYIDHATVAAPTVEVDATENATITAVSVGGVEADKFALGGSFSLNSIANTMEARI